MEIAVIGGGPAGLRAAEIAVASGDRVTLYDAQLSVGRKFLVAGRGGLNLTHAEPLECFATRYSGHPEVWRALLGECGPTAVQEWASELGIETFAASTGRIYPREMKAAPLLRRWVQRLRAAGVKFATRHRWMGLRPGPPLQLAFTVGEEERCILADARFSRWVALHGRSSARTARGSGFLRRLGLRSRDSLPRTADGRWPGPPMWLARAEGQPLKNIVARAGKNEAMGELPVTRYGLEGGAIYALGPALRAMPSRCSRSTSNRRSRSSSSSPSWLRTPEFSP